jgi:dynein heavy chain
MVESVQEVCRQGILTYASTPRSAWVLQWPGQVVLAVSQIFWTQEVSAAMLGQYPEGADELTSASSAGGKGALAAVASRCTKQLMEVVEVVRGELSNLNRWDVSEGTLEVRVVRCHSHWHIQLMLQVLVCCSRLPKHVPVPSALA